MSPKIAFCSHTQNPFYSAVLQGVREAVESSECELLSWQGSQAVSLAAVPFIHPDGLIVGPVNPGDIPVELPRVNFSNAKEHGIRPAILNDDVEAGRAAVRAAIGAGYRQIRVLTLKGFWHMDLREEGIRKEAEVLGLEIGSLDMVSRSLRETETFETVWKEQQQAFRRFMEEVPDNSVVIALGHGNAREAMDMLKSTLGRRVPEDVGVLLVDLPDKQDETLAHIRLNGEEIGRRAVHKLLEQIAGGGKESEELELVPPNGLMPGESFRQGEEQQVYRRLRTWCEDHFPKPVQVEDMCREVGLSRRSLEMKLKDGGFPAPYEILTDIRLAEAKRLLGTTRLRMEEVAEQCGFTDGRSLRKRFQAHTGKTPRAWRNQQN